MEENGSLPKTRHRDGDRLSRLSDELLHRVMSFLTLQNAVRTSALSRRWRSLWRTLPYLNFDLQYYSFKEGSDSDSDSGYDHQRHLEAEGRSFSNFILQFLVRRTSSADLVRVRFDCSQNDGTEFTVDNSVLESLICYAIAHHVQQLDIRAVCGTVIQFPSCFTCCERLTTLKLEFVDERYEQNYGYTFDMKKLLFPSLRSLHLFRFNVMDPDFFSRVFSNSPNLQILKLQDTHFNGINSLSIQAPNLQILDFFYSADDSYYPPGFKVKLDTPNLTHFTFHGYDNPIWCSGCNLSSLDEVYLFVRRNDFVDDHEPFLGLAVSPLSLFSHAKTLKLSTQTIKVLLGHPALVESQLQFPNLKYLELFVDYDSDFPMPTNLLNKFLSNSPLLKIC